MIGLLAVLGAAAVWLVIFALISKSAKAVKNKINPPPPPPPPDPWMDNLVRTPLSSAEVRHVAGQLYTLLLSWEMDNMMAHDWVAIEFTKDSVIFGQVYKGGVIYDKDGSRKIAPSYTIPYPHALSCRKDREELLEGVLLCLRQEHPNDWYVHQLYIDGTYLILPTNAN